MIGRPIPYRDLGYPTLEDFLDQSPDMCRVQYTPTGIALHGVATAADAHVASLVARQTKKKRPAQAPARRPNSMRPWQPPAPSQPFQRQLYHRFQSNGRPQNSRPGGSGRFPVIQNRNQQINAQYHHQQRLRTPNYNTGGGGGGGGGNGGPGRGGDAAGNPAGSQMNGGGMMNKGYNNGMVNNRNRGNNSSQNKSNQQNHQVRF